MSTLREQTDALIESHNGTSQASAEELVAISLELSRSVSSASRETNPLTHSISHLAAASLAYARLKAWTDCYLSTAEQAVGPGDGRLLQ